MKRVLFAAIIALLPLELVARLWVAMDPLSAFTQGMVRDDDPELLYRNRPGAPGDGGGTINSLGMRGPEPRPGDRRMLLLGDSVAYGIHLDDDVTFARLVERERSGWSVLNASGIGYATWQERALLRKLDAQIQPDSVMVAFCPNDRNKMTQALAWWSAIGEQEAVFARIEPGPIGLVNAGQYLSAIASARKIARQSEATPRAIHWKGEWADAWSDLMRDAAREGRPAWAVLIPVEGMLDDERTSTDAEALELARQAGVRVIDPLDRFRAEPQGTLYLPHDPVHLSARGHAIVADAIVSALSAS